LVRRRRSPRRIEELDGSLAEGQHDFREAFGETFARAQIEGDPLPTPVVDEELHRDIGFGGAVWIHTRLFPIARHGVGGASAAAVLPADAAFPGLVLIGQAGGLQHLGFLVADCLRVEVARRFHGGEGQHLGEVVLHHVPQGAAGLVVPSPLLDADGLGGRDLDAGDVVPVPDRLEDRVREAQDQDVLDGLFTQVVVDAEDLGFLAAALNNPVQGLGAAVVRAKGFLDDNPAAAGVLEQSGLGQGPAATAVEGW